MEKMRRYKISNGCKQKIIESERMEDKNQVCWRTKRI